jgi:nucleosome binding factor SPN SPT16 subunit
MDIVLNWNLPHQIVVEFAVDLQLYLLDYLMDPSMVFVLDHRYYLVEDLLAKQHLNQMLMKDRRNHMNEDLLDREREAHFNRKIRSFSYHSLY